MNLFKKIYCRMYQTIFKLAIPFMPYKKPIILDETSDLIKVLKEEQINDLLLISGKAIIEGSFFTSLINELIINNINFILYDKINTNPTDIEVNETKEIYLKNNLKGIIAVGGGSAMDLAKATGALLVKPKKSINELKGLLKIRKKLPFMCLVPTTAGSGSEVTVTAVITDSKTHIKYTINDFNLVPKYTLLNSKTISSLPFNMVTTTGLDALTHAVEAYIGKSKTKETKEAAKVAVKLIIDNLEEAAFNPQNLAAKSNMLHASYLAGIAFRKSYVGYVHAVSHSISGKYNTPHGYANAVILPVVLKMYGKSIYNSLGKLLKEIDFVDETNTNEEATIYFINWLETLYKKFNISNKVSDLKEEDIEYLASLADKEANPLYPVPVLFDKKELMKIYYKLL